MTFFQLLMLGASAFFAYKIYEHVQTLQEPHEHSEGEVQTRTAEAFSTFDATSLLEKADVELEKKNFDKALAIYSEANIKAPHNDEILFKMGYTLSQQERYDEALEYYKEALELDKENPFTYLEMGKIYMLQGENVSAKIHLKRALEIEPDFKQARDALEKLEEA